MCHALVTQGTQSPTTKTEGRLSPGNCLFMRSPFISSALIITSSLTFGCSKHSAAEQKEAAVKGSSPEAAGVAQEANSSIIAIDGSSTVFPITEAVAEEFQKTNHARVTIGVSGTGGGFKKFCAGEIAIAGASRPIRPSEVKLCAERSIEYIELPIAYDGLSVVVHPDNDLVPHMTVEELKKLWEPAAQGKITKWSQVRAGWPDKEIHLFGAGVDSGTYDYFTAAIVGKEHESRGDFTASEDDNVLVQGISTDKWALGFFGFAYYAENKSKLKLVAIDDEKDENGKGPVHPSEQSVSDGTYQPLSRPIFIYVNKKDTGRPEVSSFIDYYLTNGTPLVKEAGYIPLSPKAVALVAKRYKAGTSGSLFDGKGSTVGATVEMLLESK